jgi:hypothetical protein
MSQFTGEGRRIRCIDCLHLQGKTCVGRKDTPTVSPKKKRNCTTYDFKGEYQNSTPPESVYVPHVDPKTRQLMKKLMKLGVVPVSDEDLRESGMKRIAMPASTATAIIPGTEVQEFASMGSQSSEDKREEESLIWTPDREDV